MTSGAANNRSRFTSTDLLPKTITAHGLMFPLADQGPYTPTILAPGRSTPKAGPRVKHSRPILGADERPVPGLYAVGNSSAAPHRTGLHLRRMTFGRSSRSAISPQMPRSMNRGSDVCAGDPGRDSHKLRLPYPQTSRIEDECHHFLLGVERQCRCTPRDPQSLRDAWSDRGDLWPTRRRHGDGRPAAYPLGKDAKGYILYTANGFMSAQIMRLDRPLYQAAGLSDGTDAESAEAARVTWPTAGRTHVEDDSVVVHQTEVSLFPNWVDATASRKAVLVGQRLELTTTAPVLFGEEQLTVVLVWERA